MKKLFPLLFLCLSVSAFCQIPAISTQELSEYNMDLGVRDMKRKTPLILAPGQLSTRRFFGNLTTDTLIASIASYVRSNLILTPEGKIIVKPAQRIELYKEFTSTPETATNYTYKGKILYTQQILINWSSPSIQLIDNIGDLYYAQLTDVSLNTNGQEEIRNDVVTTGPPYLAFNPTTHTITANRPYLKSGHYGQQARIKIQYTKYQ